MKYEFDYIAQVVDRKKNFLTPCKKKRKTFNICRLNANENWKYYGQSVPNNFGVFFSWTF